MNTKPMNYAEHYCKIDRIVHENVPGELWLSDIDGARSQKADEFDRVVTVCQDSVLDTLHADQRYEIYRLCDGDCRQFDGISGTDDYEVFRSAIRSIVDSLHDGERVLVHCHAGLSRSVSTAAGVYATVNDVEEADEAYEAVKDVRGYITPMPGMQERLQRYLAERWRGR